MFACFPQNSYIFLTFAIEESRKFQSLFVEIQSQLPGCFFNRFALSVTFINWTAFRTPYSEPAIIEVPLIFRPTATNTSSSHFDLNEHNSIHLSGLKL